jgi:hypothetical protein
MTVKQHRRPDDPVALDRLFECVDCCGEFEASEMAQERGKPGIRCKPCERQVKRRRERDADRRRRPDGQVVEHPQESDPQPARDLLVLLREDRDEYGLKFSEVWKEDVECVLKGVGDPQERAMWRKALLSTRAAWQKAFYRQEGPGGSLSPTLLDALSSSRTTVHGRGSLPVRFGNRADLDVYRPGAGEIAA